MSAVLPIKSGRQEPPRIYGVTLKTYEQLDLDEAICDAAGLDRGDYKQVLMLKRRLHWKMTEELDTNVYWDDVTIRLCEDLDVDWRRFPHNTPLLPSTGFAALAQRQLADLKRVTNQTLWDIQERRFHDLWKAWAHGNCTVASCAERSHRYCTENFEEPDFMAIARSIYSKAERRVQPGLRLASSNGRRVDREARP